MWHTGVLIFVLILLLFLNKVTSNKPNAVKYHFKFSIFYFVTLLVSAVALPFFLLRPRDLRNGKYTNGIIGYVVGKIYNVEWVLRNREILSEERGAVIVCNHQSSLDILGQFTIWHNVGKTAAIAKRELLYVFPFGLSAYLTGVEFIDRNNSKNAYKQLKYISDAMVKNQTKIWLFPEGTRNKDSTRLLPFKKGAFNIAVDAQVPIIPVVFSPYYFINPQKYIFGTGHIIIEALEPIPTVGLTKDDVPNLIAKVHEIMSVKYKELSKEVLGDLPSN